MNRETERRVEELGNSITVAIRDIMDMDRERPMTARVEEMGMEEPIPHLQQPLNFLNRANYQPEISQVNNGFIVRLGCQQFVFETYDKMSKYLKMYFEDPNGTESKFNANELFK
jgi:hypothetical protein